MERKYRRKISINGKIKLYSHYVWYAHTGHWPIFPDEVVHHIDGDTTNDVFGNLQLMSKAAHHSLHNNGKNNSMYGKIGVKNPGWLGDAATPHSKNTRISRARKRAALREIILLPPGVTTTGAVSFSPPESVRCDDGLRHQMAKREPVLGPSVPSECPPLISPSSPTPSKEDKE